MTTYTVGQTLAAHTFLTLCQQANSKFADRADAANRLVDTFVPHAQPRNDMVSLIPLARVITNPVRHTFVPRTGAGYRDNCHVCQGHRYDGQHPRPDAGAPLPDFS